MPFQYKCTVLSNKYLSYIQPLHHFTWRKLNINYLCILNFPKVRIFLTNRYKMIYILYPSITNRTILFFCPIVSVLNLPVSMCRVVHTLNTYWIAHRNENTLPLYQILWNSCWCIFYNLVNINYTFVLSMVWVSSQIYSEYTSQSHWQPKWVLFV